MCMDLYFRLFHMRGRHSAPLPDCLSPVANSTSRGAGWLGAALRWHTLSEVVMGTRHVASLALAHLCPPLLPNAYPATSTT